MVSVVLFLIISSGGVFCAANGRKRYEELLPISCSAIVIILFLCGLIKKLELGVYLIVCVSVLLYIAAVITIVKNKSIQTFIANCFTPAFICFAIFFVIAAVLNYGKLADGWDEFSHWVDIVKAMTTLNDFGTNPNSASMFQSYPPGVALFQYFLQKINGMVTGEIFSEWRVYTAYQVFLIAFFLPFFNRLRYKNPGMIVITAATIFLTPMVCFPNLYTKVYIDPVLGILSATGLATVFLASKKDIFYSANILLTISMLVLAKDAGLLFAAFVAMAYMIDIIFGDRSKSTLRKTACIMSSVMALLIPKLLWNYNIESNHATVLFSAPIDFVDLFQVLTGRVSSYRTTTMKNFFHAITSSGIALGNTGISLNYVAFFAVIMCGIYLTCKAYQKNGIFSKGKSALIIGITSVQTIVYVLGICVNYMYKFSEREAVRLASFSRYMKVSYVSIWMVLTILLLVYLQEHEEKSFMAVITFSVILCISPVKEVGDFFRREHVIQSKKIRAPYEEISDKIQQMVEPGSRIYIVSQEDNGFDYWILRFNARPQTVSENYTWSLAEERAPNDHKTRVITAAEWREELCAGYDYVILYKMNDLFLNTYGGVFADRESIVENALYRVNKESGLLELVP